MHDFSVYTWNQRLRNSKKNIYAETTVKPLNSGHLTGFQRGVRYWEITLTKIVTFGTKHFVRYSRHVRCWEGSLYIHLFVTVIKPIKCQCCPRIETSQLICTASQLTGLYMRATLALRVNHTIPTSLCVIKTPNPNHQRKAN